MHIGFRTSGGRGEYELVGGHAGQAASGLEGWTLSLRWPDGKVRDTELWLDPGASGKPRLRSIAKKPFQIGRQVAAMLLMPTPRREMRGAASILPVMREREYLVTKVGFGPGTEFASPPETVTAEPNYVEVTNATHSGYINVQARWLRIESILLEAGTFPSEIGEKLGELHAILRSGAPVNEHMLRVGEDLRQTLTRLDASYVEGLDPLPALERLTGIAAVRMPELPPPDELSEDEVEVKARSAQLYRMAKTRDIAARRFSAEVRSAYHDSCAFCGARFGAIPGVPSGIDAAHILAWSAYDLDIVSNGIALCRNHHWAFDSALMVPVVRRDGLIVIRFTTLSRNLDADTLAILGTDGFVVPEVWLPVDPRLRPSKKYLERLYDDLVIEF